MLDVPDIAKIDWNNSDVKILFQLSEKYLPKRVMGAVLALEHVLNSTDA